MMRKLMFGLVSRQTIHLVAGARPNVMKVGPLYHALAASSWARPVLVNTGQHFGAEMSDVFFRELDLPQPHHHLQATGATHGALTAAVLVAYEALLLRERPDWVIVAGDVNSTLAACLAARKLHIPVAHLEAGLRSGDRTMPEEINRIAVDGMADLLWTPSPDADDNLHREGVPAERIDRIGNVMIDAYCRLEPAISRAATPSKLGVADRRYVVVTLHRPSNVDHADRLGVIVAQLAALQRDATVLFPVHPRTAQRLTAEQRLTLESAGVRLLPPMGYVEFMGLVREAAVVVTDSGGVQEETSYLGIPCLTVRDSTERPITVTLGTNRLVALTDVATVARRQVHVRPAVPAIPLWDGHAAHRAVESLARRM